MKAEVKIVKTTWKIFWGLGFVLVAVALLLDALGVLSAITSPFGEVSILALVAAFLLFAHALSRLIKGAIGEIFVPLALIFMLLEKNIAHVMGLDDPNIINNWMLLLCSALLGIGFSILFSGMKRKKKCKNIDGGHISSGSLGATVKYISCDGFQFESVENDLGSYTVFFENTDKYEGGGVLEIENNLGAMTINVPSSWHIIMQIDNSLGASSRPSEDNPDGPVITIKGENNLGSVAVKYV
jgi:hypothetical protein